MMLKLEKYVINNEWKRTEANESETRNGVV